MDEQSHSFTYTKVCNSAEELTQWLEDKARNERLAAQLDVFDGTACREEQEMGNGRCGMCVDCLRADASRATFLAVHLFQMIIPETWRDFGGDDGQGHYEGDFRAEQIDLELRQLESRYPRGPATE